MVLVLLEKCRVSSKSGKMYFRKLPGVIDNVTSSLRNQTVYSQKYQTVGVWRVHSRGRSEEGCIGGLMSLEEH